MTPHAFELTLSHKVPPRAVSAPVAALWWAKKGDWDKAHRLVMDETGPQAAWVHAYLHRAEGDLGNAGYWYRQARKPVCTATIEAEWTDMVDELLSH